MSGGQIDELLLDDLVDQARCGSQAAFARLWQELSPVVAGYLRGRGVRDVEDVTSEVFLAAFGQISAFTGQGRQFRRWLFTIAHHRGVDDLRARIRRDVEESYEPVSDPRAVDSAEIDAIRSTGLQDALALLTCLPTDQQSVLLLRVVADLPIADVAAVLERSPEAVRQLQHRAITRLRRELTATQERDRVTPTGLPTIAGM